MPPNSNIPTNNVPNDTLQTAGFPAVPSLDALTKVKRYLSIFVPSAMGMVFYVFLMTLIIIMHQFSSITQYLQLTEVNLMQSFMTWLERLLNATIGKGTTETLVVGLFWAVVGLGVYVFLRGIADFLYELGEGYDERGYVWPKDGDRNRPLVEAMERIISRVMAFLVLIMIVFGPLAAVISGPIWETFIGPDQLLQILFWFPAGVLTMHLCIVLVRLVLFRRRILD